MVKLETRQKELQAFLAEAGESPALFHSNMAGYYRRQVSALHEILDSGPEVERMKATETLRSLVSAIVLLPKTQKPPALPRQEDRN